MIKIVNVTTLHGEVTLTIEYDLETETHTLTITESNLAERLKALKKLVGRQLTLQDMKDVLIQIVNEARADKQTLLERFDFEPYINVDLES